MIVTFVVPGGDPRFCLVLPNGRQIWAQTSGQAHVRKQYSARLQTRGGKGAVHFSAQSGALPNGLALDATTGAITGTPTKKQQTTAIIAANDSSTHPQKAALPLSFTVT